MKNYQFIVFALVGLAIAAAVFLKSGHKKPCNCGGAAADAIDPSAE